MISAKDKHRDEDARNLFRPGVYRHYKGGEYSAFGLIRHHETGRSYVMYASKETGSLRTRPLVKTEDLLCPGGDDQDAWMDEVLVDRFQQGPPVPRFRYLGPLP